MAGVIWERMHGHAHHRHGSLERNARVSRKLLWSTAATGAFVAIELAVGMRAHSLALIGDALHNFTDALALILAWVALRFEQRPATSEKSYGYQRAGTLAAFVNAGTLVGFTVYLVVEAIDRFAAPRSVDSRLMLATAVIAIVLNVAITLLLRRDGEHDVNVRSAVVHMIGDALSSAGIVVAAVLIARTGSVVWDPAISILIAVLILWSSWGILRETVNLLLEGTPSGIEPAEVVRSLAQIEGIEGVHHLHIWALAPARPALSCHILVSDVPVSTTAALLATVNDHLERAYGIVHTTVQFEHAGCAEDDPFCIPYSGSVPRED